jgi:predicted DNA-binding protein (MmcQ/YjbR family)
MLKTQNEQTLAKLRALCLALPETSETASWNHPNFKAGKKTFVAFERVKGRASIAFRLEPGEVERLLQRTQFFETPYGRGLWASLWADGPIDWPAVQELVERSYRVVAVKRMITVLETNQVKDQRSNVKGTGQRSKGKAVGQKARR